MDAQHGFSEFRPLRVVRVASIPSSIKHILLMHWSDEPLGESPSSGSTCSLSRFRRLEAQFGHHLPTGLAQHFSQAALPASGDSPYPDHVPGISAFGTSRNFAATQ